MLDQCKKKRCPEGKTTARTKKTWSGLAIKHFAARGGQLVHLAASVCLVCVVRRTRETRQTRRSPRALAITYTPFALLSTLSPHTRHPQFSSRRSWHVQGMDHADLKKVEYLGPLLSPSPSRIVDEAPALLIFLKHPNRLASAHIPNQVDPSFM